MPTSGRRSRGNSAGSRATSADGLRPADTNRPDDVPPVAQPNLADVPDDVLREMCPAVDMIKSHQWASLKKWLLEKLEDGEEEQILATSEDDSEASRVNCLPQQCLRVSTGMRKGHITHGVCPFDRLNLPQGRAHQHECGQESRTCSPLHRSWRQH